MKADRPDPDEIYKRLICEPSMTNDFANWLVNLHEMIADLAERVEALERSLKRTQNAYVGQDQRIEGLRAEWAATRAGMEDRFND